MSPVTTVCSKCLRIRLCQCPRTDGRQRRRRQAANIESRRKTRHWARLRLQRLKLAGGLCELRRAGCTRIATTVHLVGGGNHETATLEWTRAACRACHGAEDGGKRPSRARIF